MQKLRSDISAIFDVHGALAAPPHLTFFYSLHAARIKQVGLALSWLALHQQPFTVPFTRFASFDMATWFLEPERLPELFDLKRRVCGVVRDTAGVSESRAVELTNFHVTLAYKDVTRPVHGRIGAYLAKQPLPVRAFLLDSISLLRFDSAEHRWDETRRFPFLANGTS